MGNYLMSTMNLQFTHHFQCSECEGWWSISSPVYWQPAELYCTHCGTKHDYSYLHENFSDQKLKEEFLSEAKTLPNTAL